MSTIQCSLDEVHDYKKLCFEVTGEVIGKGRPRFTTRGGYVKTYEPKKTKDYEKLIKNAYVQKYKNYVSDKAICISVYIYTKPAESISKLKKTSFLNNEYLPTKKPDIDNVMKCVLDALNKVAYHDDTQVVDQVTRKRFGEKEKILVFIKEIGLRMQDR